VFPAATTSRIKYFPIEKVKEIYVANRKIVFAEFGFATREIRFGLVFNNNQVFV